MNDRRGFTVIELLTVVAVIGILSALAITRYNQTLRKANEGAAKGNLGTIRSALRIYYADMEGGAYPETLAVLAQNSTFLPRVPEVEAPPYHPDSNAVRTSAGAANDAGGWQYNNVPSDLNYGTLWVNCTHTDSAGSVWTSY